MRQLFIGAAIATIAFQSFAANANDYLKWDMKELKEEYHSLKRAYNNGEHKEILGKLNQAKFTFKFRKGVDENKIVTGLLVRNDPAEIDAFLNARVVHINAWFQKTEKKRDHVKKEHDEARVAEKHNKRKNELTKVVAAYKGNDEAKQDFLKNRAQKTKARAERFQGKLIELYTQQLTDMINK